MQRMFLNTLATVVALCALVAVVATPVSAAGLVPFYAAFAGSAGFTGPGTGAYDGAGQATHLGASRVHGEIQVTVMPNDCGGFTAQHSDIITAANGDQLYLRVVEEACPTPSGEFRCLGTYAITGGTGRFARATGSGVFDGLVNFDQGKFRATYSGQISVAR
jgi:hypothetical protein